VDPALVGTILILAAIAMSALVVPLWWFQPRRRARRLLARASRKPLATIVAGDRARALGVVVRAKRTVVAPFSRRRCVAFRATIEELQSQGEAPAWRQIFAVEECLPFDLSADGVEAGVEGPFLLGLEVDARTEGEHETSPQVLDAMRRLGVDMQGAPGRPRKLRFREAVLEPNDPVWVLGRASVVVDPDGRRESLRGEPVKRVIRGSKREPVVLADEDGPGVLDRFG
jgi:hypothetical protein